MSPSRAGRPAALTQPQIVKAALILSRATSYEALTMRGLAAELGVGAMTIYNYVPNKAALLELISDHLLRPIPIPPSDSAAWDQRLLTLQRAIRAALARYPGIGVGPSTEATRLERGAKSILVEAGFSAADVRVAFAVLWTLMLGRLEVDDEHFEFAFEAVAEALKQRPAQRPSAPRQPRLSRRRVRQA